MIRRLKIPKIPIMALGNNQIKSQIDWIALSSFVGYTNLINPDDQLEPGTINFDELVNTECDIAHLPLRTTNNTVLLFYSSGTTGLPKGVEQTHQNVISTLCQCDHGHFKISVETTETHQDVVPATVPHFHVFGFTIVLLSHLYSLTKLITLPKLSTELYAKCLEKSKPNKIYCVPPIVSLMTNNTKIKKEYLESTRAIICGAAPIGKLDEQAFEDKFGEQIRLLQGYGLSEACATHFNPFEAISNKDTFGSIGQLLPNTFAKVVSPDNPLGKPLGHNQPGELLLKGPQVMKGYLNKPKETNEMFVDGWMRTGDMVYYDENKMFYIVDRLKELIKVEGFQVAPAELEEILRSHTDVADAGVIGISHKMSGEVPKAYVVLKLGSELRTNELDEFVKQKVAKYKNLVGGIKILQSIPKTPSGKILRRELRKIHEKGDK